MYDSMAKEDRLDQYRYPDADQLEYIHHHDNKSVTPFRLSSIRYQEEDGCLTLIQLCWSNGSYQMYSPLHTKPNGAISGQQVDCSEEVILQGKFKTARIDTEKTIRSIKVKYKT